MIMDEKKTVTYEKKWLTFVLKEQIQYGLFLLYSPGVSATMRYNE